MNERQKEKLEKLESQTAQIRKTAIALEASLQRKEEQLKKEYEEDPDLVQFSQERKPEAYLKRLTKKTKSEILVAGTPKETGFLIAISHIYENKGEKRLLTSQEEATIRERFNDTEKQDINLYTSYIFALTDIEPSIVQAFLNYQRDVAYLAFYLAQWRDYETLAALLTELRKTAEGSDLSAVADTLPLRNKVKIFYEQKSKCFKVDIGDPEEQCLAREIRMRKMFLQETVRDIKAKLTALERYLKERKLKTTALPIEMQICIKDIKIEGYIGGFNFEKKYFRSYINEKISKGEEITKQDIEQAVFPDYYELIPSDYLIKVTKARLDNFQKDLYNDLNANL